VTVLEYPPRGHGAAIATFLYPESNGRVFEFTPGSTTGSDGLAVVGSISAVLRLPASSSTPLPGCCERRNARGTALRYALATSTHSA
jgi:hypothetical protein